MSEKSQTVEHNNSESVLFPPIFRGFVYEGSNMPLSTFVYPVSTYCVLNGKNEPIAIARINNRA